MEGERIGVYICNCGSNIANVVDVDAVRTFAESLRALAPLVARLNRRRGELTQMRRKSRRLIDGNGARRVVDEILRACRQNNRRPTRVRKGPGTTRRAGI